MKNESKSFEIDYKTGFIGYFLLVLFTITSVLLVNCTSPTQRAAGLAIRNSSALINPLAVLGINARKSPPSMTIEKFLSQNNTTQITDAEAELMLNTIKEQDKTVELLINE